jgi:hypothetical protein
MVVTGLILYHLDILQADFFGVNLYEWCGNSTFQTSGYADRTKEFANYSIPVFLSEYGCNLVSPRQFTEVAAIYGPDMTNVWSGGIVYEWSQQDNSYGLVQVDASGNTTPLPDYQNLKSQLTRVSPKGVSMDSYSPSSQASQCPAEDTNWQASSNLPPTPSEGSCKCMVDSLSCVVSSSALSTSTNGTSFIGDQLNILCGSNNCSDISADGTKGIYGSFSYCAPQDKLSYMYGVASNGDSSKCSFDGHAMQAQPSQSNIQSCSKIKATTPQSGINGGHVSSTSQSTANSRLAQVNYKLFALITATPLILNTIQNFM